ncbi:(Fe-S)-binding protein [Thermodesulfobacteriota bacterium]
MLAIASRVFYVWEDPKVLSITDVLPGANCGGCGNPGCAAAAEAVAAGREPPNLCVVGGFEVAQAIGEIMGQKVEAKEPDFSWTSCLYGVGEADPIYTYNGATDCRAAMMLYGGSKLCPVGCIGLGTCVQSCQFDALKIGDDNLPVVNYDNCVGCGACVTACPKNIVSLTSATRRVMSEYVTDECTAPCQRACPTGINIRGYVHEIRKGNFEEALRIIKEKCPLPLICGHICPAPCELSCRRNEVDEAVAINPLKRFVADYEMATGQHINPYKASSREQKIALIGGGAEGLTASYYLARLGYQPTIFEAKPELGGILRYVIAGDRLPHGVLDHDINGILEMGVEAKTGMIMGNDFTISSLLQEGYDAVLTNLKIDLTWKLNS